MSRQKSPSPSSRAPDNGNGAESEARPAGSLEEFLQPASAKLAHYRAEAVDFARRDPEKALLWALAAGYVLRLLPITRIVGLALTMVELAWKPAVLFFGGRALWEKFGGGTPTGVLGTK
jgi:hypothetical protein